MIKTDHLVRRTKIIATLGPATDAPEVLNKIITAGVNVVRLNFSHGPHEDHQKRIENVRKIAAEQNKVVGILADLQGPKIRVANFKEKKVTLKVGDTFVLDAALDDNAGTAEQVGIDYKNLPNDVFPKDILLLDDGRLRLQVESVKPPRIYCRVLVGGVLSNHKGINRLGGGLTADAITEKDKQDLQFALSLDVDYIAVSFPRNAEDIHNARRLIEQYSVNSKDRAGIIAKIERTEAVTAIDEIINASDGVMVARGDLAVEIGDAEVPIVQKDIIRRSRRLNKPVIIATQMMESMVNSTVPTRAEVSDVANAVLDQADAVMTSAETASGQYPVEVIEAMARVCRTVEKNPTLHVSGHRLEVRFERVDEAIAMSTMYAANHLDISAILALTESGRTPLWMSRIRTAIPIYGLSRDAKTLGKMSLYRGVFPISFDVTQYVDAVIDHEVIRVVNQLKLIYEDDLVVITKGDHIGITGSSNVMKILKVGDVL